MISRGFYDAMAIWPTICWPLVISSCFFAYLKICKDMRAQYGYSPIGGHRKAEMVVTYLALPFASIVELAAHGYMLLVIGWKYALVAIPVYIFGWILLPSLLNGMRSGLAILATVHLLFVAAFVVLLGFVDIAVLRALNQDLYTLLTSYPVAM